MRILQLTSHYEPNVGGVETHLSDLVSELINRKSKVFVLTYRPITTKAKWKVFESTKNLKIFRIPWIPGLFYKLVNKPILEFLYLVPGLFFVAPIYILINRVEVIQAHGLVAGYVGVFWGKLLGKRVVVTTHSEYEFPKSGLYREFATWIFSNSDCVLTLSKKSKKEVVSLGVDEKNVKVFTYWIDLDKFKNIKNAKKKLGWEGFNVLFVGRLVPEKGIKVLIDSAKEWNKKINLKIIGGGPLEDEIRKDVKKKDNIDFVGRVNYEKIADYYFAADLVIVPSIHEEGFGRVIIESLACGTPVVASNRGGIKEAMDNTVGSLIEINEENIKKEVEKYYKNKNILTKKAGRARKYAVKRYSSENIDVIIDTYSKE